MAVLGVVVVAYPGLLVAGVDQEYGSAGSTWWQNAVYAAVFGVIGGILLLAALRLIQRATAASLVLAVAVVLSMIGAVAGTTLGTWAHQRAVREATTGCTVARAAALTTLGLPNPIGSPEATTDGACQSTFMVPGTQMEAFDRVQATLLANGWAKVPTTGFLAARYWKGGITVFMSEADARTDPNVVTVLIRAD